MSRTPQRSDSNQSHAVLVAIIGAASVIIVALIQRQWRDASLASPTTASAPQRPAVVRDSTTGSSAPRRQKFEIIEPADGAVVGPTASVRATSVYGNRHHYVVVTTVRDGGRSVQAYEMRYVAGTLTGTAVFGSASAGVGEDFKIGIVATARVLPEGPLVDPPDAVWSNEVLVHRRS